MKKFKKFIGPNRRPGQSELVHINLSGETDAEKKLLQENKDQDTIKLYYQEAVNEIGSVNEEYALLRVVDQTQWPEAAIVEVQKIIGLGN